MKATEAKLLDFLKKSSQFVIPIYQRAYSWTEKECRQLWEDILRCGINDKIPVHFIGSIVYVEQGLSQVSHQSPLLVIDGQQRLTTISLLLTALAEAVPDQEPFEGFTTKKIRNYYLLNPEEDGEKYFKLILSETDERTLKTIIDQTEMPTNFSIRIKENYENFKKWIQENSNQLTQLCKGIAKLVIVDIALNREYDNPQLIFESMNSTGKELSQADLIRNYILMGLEPNLQTKLYRDYWRPMEIDFGQEAYGSYFDSFMRHYLTVKTGEIPRLDGVYEAFKDHAHTINVGSKNYEITIESIIKDLREYSKYYCAMALSKETDPDLKKAFQDLRELKVDVAYPFLLELYHDYSREILSKTDFNTIVRWVEAYVFRRAICSIPTNSMNKTFANFGKFLNKEKYLESVAAQFLLLPSYRRYPIDDEFIKDFKSRDLYNFRSRSYWLRRFENQGRKETVSVDEYTIEHIMPQNENLNDQWKQDLGQEWERIHETLLHTAGNLTLTGYNSEYSDRSFKEKREMRGGFKDSPLRVNEGLGVIEKWNEESIQNRANSLAIKAAEVWSVPVLDASILSLYVKKEKTSPFFTIDDHPYLMTAEMNPIFEAFRREVLALDPCITEEFLKLYIAYKAETNFVDIVPQAKRLRLSLNMKFNEVNDPRGLCKDVTQLGRWGNGDVEIGLSSLAELPYVIGLVRQALDKQLGESTSL